MKKKATKQDLVESFKGAAANHFKASLSGDYKVANREAKIVNKSFAQLKEMGEDGYQELMTLLKDENKVVATKAAAFLLRYATDESTKVLKECAQDKGLLGFMAEQAIERWKEGNWHLDE